MNITFCFKGDMKCSKCNTDLHPTANFCGGCSNPVDISDHKDDLVQCSDTYCGSWQKKGMTYCSSCSLALNVPVNSSPDNSTNKNDNTAVYNGKATCTIIPRAVGGMP